jgi:hypothetical protein
MNERILELYKQAHVPDTAIDPSNNMHYQTTTFSAEKFAELIVQKCANVCQNDDDSARILDAFGVEE